jgi:hypothetical protein
MMIGFYFLKGDGSSQFSPTFPRGGLAATFSVQVLQRIGSSNSLVIVVQHKNRTDVSWTTAGTFSTINSAPGIETLDVTALKEEIRISYTLSASNAWEGFLLNVLAPIWRPD